MADSFAIVAVRLAGWNENETEETDHHTEYRVETTVRRNLHEETIVTYSRYRHFAALHAELQRCMPAHPSFATDFPVPKLIFHTDAAKRERADALSRYLNDVVLATSCPETPVQSLSRDPRGGRGSALPLPRRRRGAADIDTALVNVGHQRGHRVPRRRWQ